MMPAELTFRIETAPYTNMNDFTLYAQNVPASALPNITDIHAEPGFSEHPYTTQRQGIQNPAAAMRFIGLCYL